MRTLTLPILLILALSVTSSQAHISKLVKNKLNKNCPPPGFTSVADFDIEAFISAPWFVQQQQPLVYQPRDSLFCVRAEYLPIDETNLSKGLVVLNYANQGRVNGPSQGTAGSGASGGGPFADVRLTATIPNASVPSKLRVGFEGPLGSLLGRGDYWVVDVGDQYEWAIISGGAPEVDGRDNLCLTGTKLENRFQTNNVGLWLFSRTQVDPAGTAIMLERARQLGLDTSQLLPVAQEGCLYEGTW